MNADNETIRYSLIKSRRKTIAIQVMPSLEVVVRAPQTMPRAAIDAFVSGHAQWIRTHLERQRQRAETVPPPPTDAEIKALKEKAQAYLPDRVAHYAKLMGLAPAGISITSAKTRFGSCSGKNRLCFSYLLMRYPVEAVDYVIVHELAHIVHKNHGKAFYALIAQYMPDHLARRALLRTDHKTE